MGSAAIVTWQQGLGCFPGSQISTLGNGPKSLPERAENVPFATHSEDLFGFKEVGPFLHYFYNTWSPKPLPLMLLISNAFRFDSVWAIIL